MPERDDVSGLAYVDLAGLPPEATAVVDLIDAGGPFPYDKDGSTFGNYEGLLPDHEDGYYREYTVETPGSSDRGARRIVGGSQGELYWTEDHYESFEVIWR
ncbi:ribonuclease N [Nocardioides humilatus]|uniref:Ribonuclease N n=2 Tax=Nocardioides humilatus TaxID=2607660 RepID=A0A5B1LBA0_9ACTN|nr:ribonuclease N [Nocardioides humilatus]